MRRLSCVFIVCCAVLATAHSVSAAPLPATVAGCDQDDPSVNRCLDHLRHELKASCAGNNTDCSLELGPGDFYLFGQLKASAPSSLDAANEEIFMFSRMARVRVAGSGVNTTRLILADVGTVFRMSESRDLDFSGFTVTSVRTPYTFGIATSEDTISFDPARYPVNTSRWPWLGTGVFANTYTITEGSMGSADMAGHFGHLYYDQVHTAPAALSYPTAGSMSVRGLKGPLAVGAPTVIRHAKFKDVTFSIYDTTSVSITDVAIHSGVGQAVACVACGGVSVVRTSIVPAPGEPMSVNAGGIVLGGVRRGEGLEVVNSTVIGTGDDTFNVVTHYCVVSAVSADQRTITINLKALGASMKYFSAGRGLQFVNSSSMAVMANARIASVGRDTVTVTAPMPASIRAQPQSEPSLRSGLWQLVVFADESVASPVVLAGNRFGRNIGRNVLMRGVNVSITHNVFEYALGPAILMNNDLCVFFGGAVITNATIAHNRIVSPLVGGTANPLSNQYGAIYLGAHVLVPRYSRDGSLAKDGTCVQATATDAVGRLLYHNVVVHGNAVVYGAAVGASVLPTFEGSLTANLQLTNNTIEREVAAGAMPSLPVHEFIIGGETKRLGSIQGNACSTVASNGAQQQYPC